MNKKTLLFTVGEDIIARNILFTKFWSEFKIKAIDFQIILAVQEEKLLHYKKIFEDGDNVRVVSFKALAHGKLDNAVLSLARSGIDTKTNLWSKMRSYLRGDSGFVETWVKRGITATLGKSNLFKKIIRKIILILPPDQAAVQLFEKNNIDVFIPLSLTNFDFDVELARACRRKGVPMIGMVRSWDNLSSHGLLRVVPDIFILQNDFLKEMAIKYQAIDPNKTEILISGLPHYDEYLNHNESVLSRIEFCKNNGLDPEKKIILYCGMGSFLFTHEADLIDIFENAIEDGILPHDTHILYSAHPKFLSSLDKLRGKKHVIESIKIVYTDKDKDSWDGQRGNNLNLINLLAHSDVVVMGASSMAIDATLLDRPVICIAFDGNEKKIPYFESIQRFYDCYTHFEELSKSKGFRIAYSKDELMKFINLYLLNPETDAKERKEIAKRFVSVTDGHSSERLAEQLYKSIIKLS